MKLVIDSKIPFIRGFAEQLGETSYIEGCKICASDVQDADALIIRTRTRCDKNLLEGSKVQFIATATIGYDHLDTDYLKNVGIAWTNCPGCNATSVAQYVRNALFLLASHNCFTSNKSLIHAERNVEKIPYEVFNSLTLGIVGVGHVGSQVLYMAKKLGFKNILLCDPIRAEHEKGNNIFSSLNDVASQADIISFHTPLTYPTQATNYPTYHFIGEDFFQNLKKVPVIINTSRGEVICTDALRRALNNKQIKAVVIDTWENEPFIDKQLLRDAFLATPHIAGYSADGKANGTRMALEAVARFFHKEYSFISQIKPPHLPSNYAYYPEGYAYQLAEELRLYDPLRDSIALKQNPNAFEKLRGNYPLRREY